jgi:hypothetical protein
MRVDCSGIGRVIYRNVVPQNRVVAVLAGVVGAQASIVFGTLILRSFEKVPSYRVSLLNTADENPGFVLSCPGYKNEICPDREPSLSEIYSYESIVLPFAAGMIVTVVTTVFLNALVSLADRLNANFFRRNISKVEIEKKDN